MKIDYEKTWNFILIAIIYIVIWQLTVWIVNYCSNRTNYEREPFRFFMFIGIMLGAITLFILVNRHKCGCYRGTEMRNPDKLIYLDDPK